MTVTTLFAAAADGDISSQSGTYSIARSGGTLSTPANTTNELWVGQILFGSYACYETFLSFDTSTIPDGDVISAITLDLWLTGDNSTTDFTIRARERDWGASVTTADYVPGINLAGVGNQLGDLGSSGIGATGAYKTFSSSASDVTNWKNMVNMKTGLVHLMLYSINHSNNIAPTTSEFLVFSSADVAGTTNDPKLTVTHAASPGPSPPPFQRSSVRTWPMRGRT